jgi:integrase
MTATPVKRRRAFTDEHVAALKRKAKRYIIADPEQRGHYLRVPPSGPVVFAATARDPWHKQQWTTLGHSDELSIEEARELARAAIKRMKTGQPGKEPPPPAAPDSVETTCRAWLARVVDKNHFRSAAQLRRIVERYVVPHPPFKGRPFVSLRRSEISAFLDRVEDEHGQHTADSVLGVLRSVAKWVASRDDDYLPPFVGGMSRVPKKARHRSRVLEDAEIKRVWRAAARFGNFGRLVRLLLLTAQRRGQVLAMRRADVRDGMWTVPGSEREKGTIGEVRLPPAALDIIREMPPLIGDDHIFTQRRFNIDRAKKMLDEASGVTGWVLHDLRRTSRSLLSRIGVPDTVAELTLGHRIPGVAGIYNRHSYFDEKSDALAALAMEIKRIVDLPEPADNVRRLRKAAAS